MASRRRGVTSRQIQLLLRKADRLFAQTAEIEAEARRQLREHFTSQQDQPTAEDRERRARISRSRSFDPIDGTS